MFASKNPNETPEPTTEDELLATRLECLWFGISGVEDFEGLLFIRENNSIHVEADGERKGGSYLIIDSEEAFRGLLKWAKAKVTCYTGRTSPEGVGL
ncbi:hypothetical protein M193_gp075 [Halorubrum tailed phage 7]|uniref:Uncharacterized protein n=1 Tax=Halorubrum sodomense tailed virus 2 TaxID=1262527 RepID=L7TK56_9CAUD|nr:hypothetical protein HSTV2_98 [Halorubrum sodomense tailed virus 2]YP_008060082.1 hypothetical protein M193_gp075 [Halorubrum tailed phage 7]AGC34365.1 hypothetical protein HSTV2_98 [Halorubrum sodomense tailed virus 2]AGM10970.1 hypothetical protein HRTV7_99 [Halorubrum tailed phage 7]